MASEHKTTEHKPIDSLVDRWRPRNDASEPEPESIHDCGHWGTLRGIKDRATMLELRFKTGNITAMNYAYLERAEYDPSDGIMLHFAGGGNVQIEGRRLNEDAGSPLRLFENLVRHRVAWVRESDTSGGAGVTVPRVTRIRFSQG
jgi:hypothetical protein